MKLSKIMMQFLQSCLVISLFNQLTTLAESGNDQAERCPLNCTCKPLDQSVICERTHRFHFPTNLPNGTRLLGFPKNEFTSLSDKTFKNMNINATLEILILIDNKISTIKPFAFRNVRNLRILWLFENRLSNLQAYTFSGLRELEELYLSKNLLVEIEQNAFLGLKNLKLLQLWGNRLVTLNPESFSGLDNLNNLALGDNKFKEIPTRAFQNLRNLEILEILNLPITHIRANAFNYLTKLEKLHIGDWPLQGIDDEAFSGLSSLTHLSLNHCNLEHVPYEALSALPSLKKLLLSNNTNIQSLSEQDFYNLHNLEELYLSNISLHTIHESPFKMLTKLTVLDMSQNQISTLPSHLFLQLENLRVLNLSHNLLEVLHPFSFISLEHINTIDLTNNKIICDCEIEWLKTFQEMKIRQQFKLMGTCSDPYEGKPIAALAPQYFICEEPSFSEKDKKRKLTGIVGKQANLPCHPSKGIPTPTASWTKNGGTLRENDHFTQLKNGTLYISHVEEQDKGKYECVVSNRLGKAKSVILFQIHHKPGAINSQNTGAITGAAITIVILVTIALIALFTCRKRCLKFFKHHSIYEPMDSYEDQKMPFKNGIKIN